MKWLNRFAKGANTALMVIVAIIAAVMLVSGIYVLNDIFYTNRTAFVSYDLLQYRPKVQEGDKTDNNGFTDLQKINPDTVGWIEMFGTNINYPVVQGDNNLEYLNKDIYGYSTASGSIYLAAENQSDFSDWYNIIYAHHMDNGAMFGDIGKYLDPEYFTTHSDGVMQTLDGNYMIHVFACIRTNAYEDTVYQLEDDAETRYPVLKEYIEEHAVNRTEMPDSISDGQILGMSTCVNAVTDGRIVLFARIEPLSDKDYEIVSQRVTSVDAAPPDPEQLDAVGHKIQGGRWSFLNLMCVICTLLTLFPLWALGRKFGQFPYSREMYRALEKQLDEEHQTDQEAEEQDEDNEQVEDDEQDEDNRETAVKDFRHFIRKGRIGICLEIIILIISVIVFFVTEDLTGLMGISDRWTGLMILIAAAALIVDYICLRYRGILPEETEDTEDEDNKTD